MSKYRGIEKIDPIEREKQHIITKAFWQQLCETGVKEKDKGRITCILYSKSLEKANELKSKYQGSFQANIIEGGSNYRIEVVTPLSYLTIEAFIELSDILMYSAYETDSRFDGFQVDIEEIKSLNKLNKPWWKMW